MRFGGECKEQNNTKVKRIQYQFFLLFVVFVFRIFIFNIPDMFIDTTQQHQVELKDEPMPDNNNMQGNN